MWWCFLKRLTQSVCFPQDLSLYVNEVKRDHEALQLIEEIQDRYVKQKTKREVQEVETFECYADAELKILCCVMMSGMQVFHPREGNWHFCRIIQRDKDMHRLKTPLQLEVRKKSSRSCCLDGNCFGIKVHDKKDWIEYLCLRVSQLLCENSMGNLLGKKEKKKHLHEWSTHNTCVDASVDASKDTHSVTNA